MSDAMSDSAAVTRPLPEVTPETEFHWTSGRDGVLRVQRSVPCGALLFPPVPVCPYCRSTDIEVVEVSGRGTVVGCTENVHQWLPTMAPPYSVAMVALDEDDRVRLTTNVVGCDPGDVHVGMRVAVQFEQQDDVWFPLFAPTGDPEPGPLPGEDETMWHARPMASPEKFEDTVAISGIGHVGSRPSPDARSALAHRRGLHARDRRRRPGARGHRRTLDLSRPDGRGRALRRWCHRARVRDAPPADVVQRRPGDAGAVRGDRQRDARGRVRSVPPRAVLPHRLGVDPRRAPAPGPRRAWWPGPDRRRHAVAHSVRSAVRRELDRDERVAAHAPIRHHA